jgi:L-seryl-tRNA(Ser) seleniumtransferase
MARRLLPVAQSALGDEIIVSFVDCGSQIGSGALPTSTVPSGGLALAPKGGGRALDALAAALRRLPVPVIGRIEDGALVLDLRCLDDETGFAANLTSFDPALGGSDGNEMA